MQRNVQQTVCMNVFNLVLTLCQMQYLEKKNCLAHVEEVGGYSHFHLAQADSVDYSNFSASSSRQAYCTLFLCTWAIAHMEISCGSQLNGGLDTAIVMQQLEFQMTIRVTEVQTPCRAVAAHLGQQNRFKSTVLL